MIRIVSQRRPAPPKWHADFLRMVPIIATHARIVFRGLGAEARQEAVAECVANALVAYCRLLELGKRDIVYPTCLARFAARQVKDDRKVGGRLNINPNNS